jgi:putative Ca2+/H+ antiporter (TMEM165/GDT1 family)
VTGPIILAFTFYTVLTVEIVGDKTFYALAALATRDRTRPLLVGALTAFALKMLAAALIGSFLRTIPGGVIRTLTVASFVGVAVSILLRRPQPFDSSSPASSHGRAAWMAFSTIFFSEWCDIGQLTAAALVARYHTAAIVWLGGVAALAVKALAAVSLGAALRTRFADSTLRAVSFSTCLLMATVSLFWPRG